MTFFEHDLVGKPVSTFPDHALTVRPGPKDANDDGADDEGKEDCPAADPDGAGGLAIHLVLRDLAVASPLFGIRGTHRTGSLLLAGSSLAQLLYACMTAAIQQTDKRTVNLSAP